MPDSKKKANKIILKRVSLTLFFCLFTSLAFAANSPPRVGSVSPSFGSSLPDTPVTFTTTYSDPNGWQDLRNVFLLINTSTNSANCFYGHYNQNTNKLYWHKEYLPLCKR